MRLLELMSLNELSEAVELLNQKLSVAESKKGLSDKRTIDIDQSLYLYLSRYIELRDPK